MAKRATKKYRTNLAELRRNAGLTQGDLAQASGVALSTIFKMEQGVQAGRVRTLAKLAPALKVPIREIQFAPLDAA